MSKLSRMIIAGLLLASCTTPKRTIKIPESVVANPKKEAAQKAAIPPYVIQVSDGKNVMKVEIPFNALNGSSTVIPLQLEHADGQVAPQTEADREIIDAKKAAGEPTPKEERGQPPKARSYLATLARVNELFKKRQYEIALIELTKLDREYPDDERILEMKGTLHWKLRRTKQARESWERVLALNPNNTVVAQALEQLDQGGE